MRDVGRNPTPPGQDTVAQTTSGLTVIVFGLAAIWAVEIAVTRGPLQSLYGPISDSFAGVGFFVLGALLAVRMAAVVSRRRNRGGGDRGVIGPVPGARGLSYIAAATAGYAAYTGQSNYELILAGQNQSLVGQLWGPVSLGAAAVILASPMRLVRRDAIALSVLLVAASLAGGRTVPGLILIMLLLRYMFLDASRSTRARKRSRAKSVLILGIAASVLVITFSVLGGIRTNALGGGGFTDADLASKGYESGPVWLRYLASTLGVIGEAARVNRVALPDLLPYQGFGLLISDMFSFLPSFVETVDLATIKPYHSVGSIVFTSHPGGTPTTLYLLGGHLGVLVGAIVYTLIIATLAQRSSLDGGVVARVLLLIFGATYLLGAYGTGTPTGAQVIAALVACSWSLLALRARHPKDRFARLRVERSQNARLR